MVPTVYLIEEYVLSVNPFSISALQDALYKETSASYMYMQSNYTTHL